MIVLAAAIISMGAAGSLVGGALGVAAIVVAPMVVLIACWWLRVRNKRALSRRAAQRQPSAYADIEDVIDRLEDLAQERNWDLDKRFEIARMACENRTAAFDELERRYDRGLRSAFDKLLQDAAEGPMADETSCGRTTISSPARADSTPKCKT